MFPAHFASELYFLIGLKEFIIQALFGHMFQKTPPRLWLVFFSVYKQGFFFLFTEILHIVMDRFSNHLLYIVNVFRILFKCLCLLPDHDVIFLSYFIILPFIPTIRLD